LTRPTRDQLAHALQGVGLGIGIGIAMYLTAKLVDETQSIQPLVIAVMWLGAGVGLAALILERATP